MDEKSYTLGKYVGFCIAAARDAKEFSSTWPSDALEKDVEEVKQWAEIHGMVVEFKDGFVNFTRRQPPELTVVK